MGSPRKAKPAPAAEVAAPVSPSTETPVSAGPVVTLAAVIEATKAGGFVFTSPAFHDPLIVSGDVEINPEMTNEQGLIATRATDKAMTIMNDTVSATVAAKPAAPKFEIDADVPIPERTRTSTGLRAGRTPVYPFDQLEVGQSFFVPNKSADKPAAKAMASTVAGANARFVEEIPGETRKNRKGNEVVKTKQLRKFKIFDTERTMPDGSVQKGARIFRVALTDSAAA